MQSVAIPYGEADAARRASQRIRRILVMLDPARDAQTQMDPVARLARQVGAEVNLMCLCPPQTLRARSRRALWHRGARRDADRASLHLARLEHTLRMRGVRVSSHLLRGTAADALQWAGTDGRADLIVIGAASDARSALLQQNNAGMTLALHAATPILLLPPSGHIAFARAIVVPFAASTPAHADLREAVSLARVFAAEVVPLTPPGEHENVASSVRDALKMVSGCGLVVLGLPAHRRDDGSLEQIVTLVCDSDAPLLLVPAAPTSLERRSPPTS